MPIPRIVCLLEEVPRFHVLFFFIYLYLVFILVHPPFSLLDTCFAIYTSVIEFYQSLSVFVDGIHILTSLSNIIIPSSEYPRLYARSSGSELKRFCTKV